MTLALPWLLDLLSEDQSLLLYLFFVPVYCSWFFSVSSLFGFVSSFLPYYVPSLCHGYFLVFYWVVGTRGLA